uniref:Transposase n=1 Tax=Echinostoma caproni TaxID=27848 RepID=A0A183BF72_9TREM
LRVRSVSSESASEIGIDASSVAGFTVNPDFYTHRAHRGDQPTDRIEEDSERQFVKMKAHRQLPSGSFMNLVLGVVSEL